MKAYAARVPVKRLAQAAMATAVALGVTFGAAHQVLAAPVTSLAMKLSDSAAVGLDAYFGWSGAGGFNEGNGAAQLLVDNGLDFKDSIVDSDWASVTSVRVAIYSGGAEQVFIEFDATGTTKTDFFSVGNVTSSSWSDIAGGHNFFSIAGHADIDRHWFVNTGYGGCPADVGHMVVLDRRASYACAWENTYVDDVGSTDRGFLYADSAVDQNWTSGAVGVGDVFAVFITRDIEVVEPASAALLGVSLLGLGALRRRRR